MILSEKGRGMVVKLLCGMLAYEVTEGGGTKQTSRNENTELSPNTVLSSNVNRLHSEFVIILYETQP